MFWKNKKCEHEWFNLETKEEYITYCNAGYIDSEKENRSYIYCPKCDKREIVSAAEWLRMERAQVIKKEFNTQ